jgi:hypothetical protein
MQSVGAVDRVPAVTLWHVTPPHLHKAPAAVDAPAPAKDEPAEKEDRPADSGLRACL